MQKFLLPVTIILALINFILILYYQYQKNKKDKKENYIIGVAFGTLFVMALLTILMPFMLIAAL